MDRILSSDDRRNFTLASEAFIARLNKGHSNCYDKYLYETFGSSLGFHVRPLKGNWVVFTSRIDRIKPGDILSTIDGQDFDAFFQANRQYVSGSSDADRAAHFFYNRHLFPHTSIVGLDDGRKIALDPMTLSPPSSANDTTEVQEEGDFQYIRIPSFEDAKFEDAAVAAVEAHLSVKAIIVDVRAMAAVRHQRHCIRS